MDRALGLLTRAGWAVLSVSLFAGLWELAWLIGVADPRFLPPPHVFLGDAGNQLAYFDSTRRWQIGTTPGGDPHPVQAVGQAVGATVGRVLAGTLLATVSAVATGLAMRFWPLLGRLTLPTARLLAPVSPFAWLPIAIFVFGIGNLPAVFMVFISLYFILTLATVSHIDRVDKVLIESAQMMGASRRRVFLCVILPAILPGLLVILRLALFAAWIAVLVAEATGVGYGLGQVVMLARNTLNPNLVFLTMGIIGLVGFAFDCGFRIVQRLALFWLPPGMDGRLGDV